MCIRDRLYGWLSVQDYYKELISTDIRKSIQDANAKIIEDDMVPFGFVDQGFNDELPEGFVQEGSW